MLREALFELSISQVPSPSVNPPSQGDYGWLMITSRTGS